MLASGGPLSLGDLGGLFGKRLRPDRGRLRNILELLAADYEGRGIELKEVASGYRIQIKSSMSDWLIPLWENRAPRYSRALLETLALIAYRQPITRGEIEEVRGVAVTTNIVRTLLERGWVNVVGHRDVPGKPAMLGTTREFLDYFGLKKLDDLPALSEFTELDDLTGMLRLSEGQAQVDMVEELKIEHSEIAKHEDGETEIQLPVTGNNNLMDDAVIPDTQPERG